MIGGKLNSSSGNREHWRHIRFPVSCAYSAAPLFLSLSFLCLRLWPVSSFLFGDVAHGEHGNEEAATRLENDSILDGTTRHEVAFSLFFFRARALFTRCYIREILKRIGIAITDIYVYSKYLELALQNWKSFYMIKVCTRINCKVNWKLRTKNFKIILGVPNYTRSLHKRFHELKLLARGIVCAYTSCYSLYVQIESFTQIGPYWRTEPIKLSLKA